METEGDTVSVDTNVVVEVSLPSPLGEAYLALLGSREAALTYFVRGELRAGRRSRERDARLARFVAGARILPAPDEDLFEHYGDANRCAHELGLARGVGEDLWMIAQTVQHGLEFATHDRNAARVARAVGLTVHTLLPNIDADYARDDERLARQRERSTQSLSVTSDQS